MEKGNKITKNDLEIAKMVIHLGTSQDEFIKERKTLGQCINNKIFEYKEKLIECLYKNNMKVVQENVYKENPNIVSFRVKTKYFQIDISEDTKHILNIPIDQLIREQVFKITEELINYKLTDIDRQLMVIDIKNG